MIHLVLRMKALRKYCSFFPQLVTNIESGLRIIVLSVEICHTSDNSLVFVPSSDESFTNKQIADEVFKVRITESHRIFRQR